MDAVWSQAGVYAEWVFMLNCCHEFIRDSLQTL
jgi:hypothetical protein